MSRNDSEFVVAGWTRPYQPDHPFAFDLTGHCVDGRGRLAEARQRGPQRQPARAPSMAARWLIPRLSEFYQLVRVHDGSINTGARCALVYPARNMGFSR